jgi:hypothetical protein
MGQPDWRLGVLAQVAMFGVEVEWFLRGWGVNWGWLWGITGREKAGDRNFVEFAYVYS